MISPSLLENSPRYREAVAAGGDAQAYIDEHRQGPAMPPIPTTAIS